MPVMEFVIVVAVLAVVGLVLFGGSSGSKPDTTKIETGDAVYTVRWSGYHSASPGYIWKATDNPALVRGVGGVVLSRGDHWWANLTDIRGTNIHMPGNIPTYSPCSATGSSRELAVSRVLHEFDRGDGEWIRQHAADQA